MKTLIVALVAGAIGVFLGLFYTEVVNVAIMKTIPLDGEIDPGGGFGVPYVSDENGTISEWSPPDYVPWF